MKISAKIEIYLEVVYEERNMGNFLAETLRHRISPFIEDYLVRNNKVEFPKGDDLDEMMKEFGVISTRFLTKRQLLEGGRT